MFLAFSSYTPTEKMILIVSKWIFNFGFFNIWRRIRWYREFWQLWEIIFLFTIPPKTSFTGRWGVFIVHRAITDWIKKGSCMQYMNDFLAAYNKCTRRDYPWWGKTACNMSLHKQIFSCRYQMYRKLPCTQVAHKNIRTHDSVGRRMTFQHTRQHAFPMYNYDQTGLHNQGNTQMYITTEGLLVYMILERSTAYNTTEIELDGHSIKDMTC